MKICRYDANEAGWIVDDNIYPLGRALLRAGYLREGYTMVDAVDALANRAGAGEAARECLKMAPVPLAAARLLAPVPNPPSLWAAAANYREHQKEMLAKMGGGDRSSLGKDDLMAEFFLKPSSSIIGPGETIILPKISKDVDFECELCAVIGRRARYVSEAEALEYVFGYTICWDISQRDPWGRGRHNTRNIRKGFDTFTGLGPWIVTRDEIADPQNLAITVEQNGQLVMNAHTSDMICTLREHIRFLASVLTLRPGDLITTGTPAGVRKLSDGDRLKGTIEKIGTMELTVRAET